MLRKTENQFGISNRTRDCRRYAWKQIVRDVTAREKFVPTPTPIQIIVILWVMGIAYRNVNIGNYVPRARVLENSFVLITQGNARISPYVRNVHTITDVNSVMPVSTKGWSGDLVIPMNFVYSNRGSDCRR